MSHLIEFAYHHWLLWLALVIVLFLLLTEEVRHHIGGIRKISSQDAVNTINREAGVIIDIRDKQAYTNGHIANAIHIPHDQLDQHLNKLSEYKAQPLIIVCQAGQVSYKFAKQLRKQGFNKVYSLDRGINGWKEIGLPLTKEN